MPSPPAFAKAFTLVEVLIGTALLIIMLFALYGAFQFSLKVVTESGAKVTAMSIASEKIEEIRNLPYKDIGTIGGIPAGTIPETTTTTRNHITFTIKTTVLYVDDPFDGLAPDDTLPTDYKRAKVSVSWSGHWGGTVFLLTDIAPQGVETEAGGGTLRISVLDASGGGVPQASVHILNSLVSPSIDATYQTDNSGNLLIAGAPTSTEAYQITVTKDGYSEDRTYSRDEIANPLKPPASVFEGQVTEISFSIDQLSSFAVETRARESFDDDFGNYSKISDYKDISVQNSEVELAKTNGAYQTSGYLLSVKVNPLDLMNWDRLLWQDEEPEGTSIKYHLLYATGTSYQLVPDSDLPGNSAGFETSPVDISSLNIIKYPSLKIEGDLSTVSTSTTPLLFDWHLTYNTPLIGNVDFLLSGAKIIGTDQDDSPVLKYSKAHTSDSTGRLTIAGLEWDSYTFSESSTTAMDLTEVVPSPQPVSLLPATTTDATLYFKAENTLLVKVEDASTTQAIFGANVRLSNATSGYDTSQPTDEYGNAFFLPLDVASYSLEVGIDGYQSASTTVNVSGHTTETIKLKSL